MSRALAGMLMAILFSASVQGAVSLAGTRLIFDGRYREASIEVSNPGEKNVLLQAWLSDASAGATTPTSLPFAVTTPLVHLPAKGRQSLRLLYEGVGMPTDRESLLHLYVLEIPQRHLAQQKLTLAIRQRINVFYRPLGLPGNPADSAALLTWQLDKPGTGRLQIHNPTAFHVSLLDLRLDDTPLADYLLIEPGEKTSLQFTPGQRAGHLSFKALTDYGGQRSYCAPLEPDVMARARLILGIPPSPSWKC
jgi:P pilus assembly chaperone PapD